MKNLGVTLLLSIYEHASAYIDFRFASSISFSAIYIINGRILYTNIDGKDHYRSSLISLMTSSSLERPQLRRRD